MSENRLREDIARLAKSLFDRGLTFGSSGNISVRLDDGWLMTPTGSSMGDLDPARISRLDRDGHHIAGDKPTKEAFLHTAMYGRRPKAGAIVHLHSTHSVAMHPADAAARGLKVEEIVRIHSAQGACPAELRISEAIRPRVIQIATGAWLDQAGEMCRQGSPNVLTRAKGTAKLSQA